MDPTLHFEFAPVTLQIEIDKEDTCFTEMEASGDDDGEMTTNRKVLTRKISASNITDKYPLNVAMTPSKIYALRQAVNRHNDAIARILITSKESVDRKSQIENAFRVCKEAFQEVSIVLAYVLENKPGLDESNIDTLKKVVGEAMGDVMAASVTTAPTADRGGEGEGKDRIIDSQHSSLRTANLYASVIGKKSRVCVS